MAVTAIIASAVVGAGTAVYTAEKQEDIAEEERKRLEREEAERKREADRIAKETRPEGEAATSIQFGTTGSTDKGGSTSDFLVTKGGGALGGTSNGGSGLGFNV